MKKLGRPQQSGEPRDTAAALKRSALDLLSHNSYRTVTIKDIGREAGVTTAMIYYHFRNKDELLRAAIEFAIENALKHFYNTSVNIVHPAAVIHEWLYMHVELQTEIGKILKLIHDYRHSDIQTGHIDEVIDRFYGTERNLIVDNVLRGRKMGIFTDSSDPVMLSELISTFLDGAVIRKRVFLDYEIRTSVSAFEQMLWQTLGFKGKVG